MGALVVSEQAALGRARPELSQRNSDFASERLPPVDETVTSCPSPRNIRSTSRQHPDVPAACLSASGCVQPLPVVGFGVELLSSSSGVFVVRAAIAGATQSGAKSLDAQTIHRSVDGDPCCSPTG